MGHTYWEHSPSTDLCLKEWKSDVGFVLVPPRMVHFSTKLLQNKSSLLLSLKQASQLCEHYFEDDGTYPYLLRAIIVPDLRNGDLKVGTFRNYVWCQFIGLGKQKRYVVQNWPAIAFLKTPPKDVFVSVSIVE